jgi:hypothetical protein
MSMWTKDFLKVTFAFAMGHKELNSVSAFRSHLDVEHLTASLEMLRHLREALGVGTRNPGDIEAEVDPWNRSTEDDFLMIVVEDVIFQLEVVLCMTEALRVHLEEVAIVTPLEADLVDYFVGGCITRKEERKVGDFLC